MSLTERDMERIQGMIRSEVRTIVRDELKPVKQRLDGVEAEIKAGFSRLTEALVYLANTGAGTVAGRKSHVAREVEKILTPT